MTQPTVSSTEVVKEKTQRICKITLTEDKILIKNIATRKVVWYEEIACRVPQETSATHNCEVSAAEDR